ncbi:MAG: glycoside hydrolase family 16 protein [Spirochaetales bacterium]|nr:glycoside hydrolase family 16 protein [Spirochaetales bacterium]
MKPSTLLFPVFLLFVSCISNNTQQPEQDTKIDEFKSTEDAELTDIQQFELIWADEFDEEGIPNPEKWKYDTGGFGWYNNELQYYTKARAENARVQDGRLIIEAHKEDFKMGAKTNHYTSARLVTKYKGDWCYGRIEVRAKLPRGNGVWPAIWMLPTKEMYGGWPSSGEIDIMEHVGYEPGIVHFSIHTNKFNHRINTHKTHTERLEEPDKQFYTYGIEWQENVIIFFVDDKKSYVFPKLEDNFMAWPFDRKFHLILNLAIGGDWGGVHGIDDTIFPQRMEVEYVRVYQRKPE